MRRLFRPRGEPGCAEREGGAGVAFIHDHRWDFCPSDLQSLPLGLERVPACEELELAFFLLKLFA